MQSFLREYDLSSQEGVLLMCVAEALLRIPDAATADKLIRDKLSQGDWERHVGRNRSLLVNAGTWGMMLTGKLVSLDRGERRQRRHVVRAARGARRRAGGARGACARA